MRITIMYVSGREAENNIPLEVESSDTIGNVKVKIEGIKWIHRNVQRLIYMGKCLEDDRILADYGIQDGFTFHLILKQGPAPWIYIKTWTGRTFALGLGRESVVYNVKQKVEEREGISMDKQRLYYAGKLLDDDARSLGDYGVDPGFILHLVRIPDDDAMLDIAAIKARRKAARSKAKRTGGGAEAAKVGLKRPMEGSSSTTPQSSARGLLLTGANRTHGVESFWDEEDFGLARRRAQALISPYDINRFESIDDRTLIESVANNCVRTLNVTAVFEHRLHEYKDSLRQVRNEVEELNKENAGVKELLRKEKDGNEKLRQELEMERLTGTFFLQSKAGRHHIETLEKSVIYDFKKSAAFQELLMEHGVSVYDKAVKEFQRLLRESGRVSEDIVQLIDPQDSEHDDDDDDDDDDYEEDDDEEEEEDEDDNHDDDED